MDPILFREKLATVVSVGFTALFLLLVLALVAGCLH
jgi:hypothetical protein